jgi:hypothetical protein
MVLRTVKYLRSGSGGFLRGELWRQDAPGGHFTLTAREFDAFWKLTTQVGCARLIIVIERCAKPISLGAVHSKSTKSGIAFRENMEQAPSMAHKNNSTPLGPGS